MQDNEHFGEPARLEEGVLNVLETDVNLVSFVRRVSHSILVQVEVSEGSLSYYIWSDYKVLKHVFPALDQLQLVLSDCHFSNTVLLVLVSGFHDFDQLLDLLVSFSQVLGVGSSVFQSQLFHVELIFSFRVRELHGRTPRNKEV